MAAGLRAVILRELCVLKFGYDSNTQLGGVAIFIVLVLFLSHCSSTSFKSARRGLLQRQQTALFLVLLSSQSTAMR